MSGLLFPMECVEKESGKTGVIVGMLDSIVGEPTFIVAWDSEDQVKLDEGADPIDVRELDFVEKAKVFITHIIGVDDDGEESEVVDVDAPSL